MGKIVKDDLVKAVARRFDYQSARNVTGRLIKDAGLSKQTDFSADDVKKVGAALAAKFDRVDAVLTALAALGGGGAKAAPKAESKAEPKAEPKAAKAEAKPEAEAEAKPKAEAEAAPEKAAEPEAAAEKAEAPAKKAEPAKKTSRGRKKTPAKKAEA